MSESFQEIADRCLKEFQTKEPDKGYWACAPVKDKPNHFVLLGNTRMVKEVRWEPDYQLFTTVHTGTAEKLKKEKLETPVQRPEIIHGELSYATGTTESMATGKSEEPKEKKPETPAQQPEIIHVELSYANETKESKFDGTVLGMIGYHLLAVIVTFCTLSLAYPWMHCMLKRWETRHTMIEGRRLCFDGKGIQLIGRWIIWLFLTIVTFGIYGLWLPIRVRQWSAKHTHFDV